MVYTEPSEGKKSKPRGRPFVKGNNKGKPRNDVLDNPGHESSIEGQPIDESKILLNLLTGEETITGQKPATQSLPIEEEQDAKEESKLPLVLVESIDFIRGENKLSIRLSKRHNRLYRLQIFLNDTTEVRPVTYTGASAAFSFWDVLKGLTK